MRSLVVTLLLFSVMLIGIVTNAVYVNTVADELAEEINALPDAHDAECVSAASALRDSWERRVDSIEFASGFTTVDRISEYAATLLACAECGDLYGYRSARALLLDAVEDMRRPESLSLGTIF